MNRLTTFQYEFEANDFSDASAFQFLLSQLFSEKDYRNKCDSCKYNRNGRCILNFICSYEEKRAR
jgi:hypothetical protein